MNFKISCLLFFHDHSDRILLIKRRKPPNDNYWSPPGGKLEMDQGESPFECAKREALEEVGIELMDADLNLFGYVSEKYYENRSHWLMFLFECKVLLDYIPDEMEEGFFQYYKREDIKHLAIPPSDHELVWPFYDQRKEGFWGIRANCSEGKTNLAIEASPTGFIK